MQNETTTGGLFTDADVIHRYSRAQAIEDGVLVDVSETAREAGIVFPVAVTQTVWSDCCEWTEADTKRSRSLACGQSTRGRLWDIVNLARFAIKIAARQRARGVDPLSRELVFGLKRLPRPGNGRRQNVRLKLVVGYGDTGESVITIMQPDED